jgi:hypothetical protein
LARPGGKNSNVTGFESQGGPCVRAAELDLPTAARDAENLVNARILADVVAIPSRQEPFQKTAGSRDSGSSTAAL